MCLLFSNKKDRNRRGIARQWLSLPVFSPGSPVVVESLLPDPKDRRLRRLQRSGWSVGRSVGCTYAGKKMNVSAVCVSVVSVSRIVLKLFMFCLCLCRVSPYFWLVIWLDFVGCADHLIIAQAQELQFQYSSTCAQLLTHRNCMLRVSNCFQDAVTEDELLLKLPQLIVRSSAGTASTSSCRQGWQVSCSRGTWELLGLKGWNRDPSTHGLRVQNLGTVLGIGRPQGLW